MDVITYPCIMSVVVYYKPPLMLGHYIPNKIMHVTISEELCQKQVSRARISNSIPQCLWDVITCPCLWFLLLAQHSWFKHVLISVSTRDPCLWALFNQSHWDAVLWHQMSFPEKTTLHHYLGDIFIHTSLFHSTDLDVNDAWSPTRTSAEQTWCCSFLDRNTGWAPEVWTHWGQDNMTSILQTFLNSFTHQILQLLLMQGLANVPN